MRKVLGIAVVVVVLSAGIVVFSGTSDYRSEIHPCTHPGMDRCPGSSVEQALHCVSCSEPEHKAGCQCLMSYPCGKDYNETSYCTPIPQ